jgi:predicted ABC-type transport system involved in lysophospholipase L1 biosynthesis ATPase subunit
LDEDGLALFRRRSIGIVFQAFHLIPTMTALENVAIPLEFAGDAKAWVKAKAALESVGAVWQSGLGRVAGLALGVGFRSARRDRAGNGEQWLVHLGLV